MTLKRFLLSIVLFVVMVVYARTQTDYSHINKIKIKEPQLATINITGIDALPTTKTDDMHGWMEYSDENGNYFKKRVILNAQGATSLQYPKKNLSMDFCEDEWIGDSTTSIQIGNWVKQDGFHFKANWIDTFRGGLAVSTAYKFYDDITKEDIPIYERANLTDYSTNALCHPDGFPCVIYLNGDFQGVYAWQMKKHRKNMNMEKDNSMHVWFQVETYTKSFNTGVINWDDIEIKNPKTVTDESKEYILELAKYDKELRTIESSSTAEIMREKISAMYDVTSVINMIIHGLITSNIDGFGKNVNFFTYDGKKWFIMPYDLDETFGNAWTASFQFPASWSFVNDDYTMINNLGYQPFYWINKYFKDEIKRKYACLRDNGAITTDNIIKHLVDWNTRVGSANYNAEYTKWNTCPSSSSTIISDAWEYIQDWTRYSYISSFDASKSYAEGDSCLYDHRIWRAKHETIGEVPVIQTGYTDTEERVRQWLDNRIELEDKYLGYDPSSASLDVIKWDINEKVCRKVLINGRLCIISPTGIYSITGVKLR